MADFNFRIADAGAYVGLLETSSDKNPPERPAQGERTFAIVRQFSLGSGEFDGMGQESFLEKYLRPVIKGMIDEVEEIETRLGRKLNFKTFKTPANGNGLKTVVYNSGGLFLAVITKVHNFHGWGDDPNKFQTEMDITVKSVVGLIGREDGRTPKPDRVKPTYSPF